MICTANFMELTSVCGFNTEAKKQRLGNDCAGHVLCLLCKQGHLSLGRRKKRALPEPFIMYAGAW